MKERKILKINGTMLNKEQLENHLQKIASSHNLTNKSQKSTYPVPHMLENYKVIQETYNLLNEHLKLGIGIHPAGEWLLDNLYIIEETVKLIKRELTLKKYTNFLGIANGQYQGFARIYVLAAEIVAYTDNKIEKHDIEGYLASYQSKKTLSMDEIWNIGIFMQIAIIENIREICEKIISCQMQKYKAENIVERLLENKTKQDQKYKNISNRKMEKIIFEDMRYPFIEYMSYILKRYGKKGYSYSNALEETIEMLGTTVSDVIKKEHFDIATKKVLMGNSITSIKTIQRINFLEIFEKINGVEEILKLDPAEVYDKMDYKTKAYYRGKIKELSKKTKISEVYIAKKIVELGTGKQGKKSHIGYYLIDEGNTIPFIARYRKEVTGGLSDEILRDLGERLNYLRNLEQRKQEVINSIDEQGKLTDEIVKSVAIAKTLAEVEDIYRPYKQKKKTRATVAKAKGLEPLAEIIIKQEEKTPIEEIAKQYINIDKLSEEDKKNKDKVVATAEDAIQGALDIIAEDISDNAKYRKEIKRLLFREGLIVTKATKEEEKSNYEMYYNYQEAIKHIPSHRILAINRGEKEDFLKVKIEKPEEKILEYIERDILKGQTQFTDMLKDTILDSFKRLIEPSIDREIRSDLTEKAEEKAIKVFGQNSKQLLLGAPIKGKTVMGFDPAYRTGCKIAVIDETGKVLDYTTVYPTEPQNDVENAKKELLKLIEKDKIDMIAIGNGTASRESEMFVADMIKEAPRPVHYAIVSEAGASVYSASKLATEEYPDINVSIRGAISIARRLQDPLAELVKIDPKAIGVGQYQHDVNQKKLAESLTGVVEDSVNKVGVDVNTATPSLLSYVSGINNTIAKNIVKYRDENGKLKNRKELLKVPKLGKVAFEQCAGFLRIMDGDNPLEITAVHPESYEATEKLLKSIGFDKNDLKDKEKLEELRNKLKTIDVKQMAKELEIGEMTLSDIISELSKPGRDPREDMPKPILRSDVLKFEDLKEGMVLTGTVRNVIDFGAFVDIGVKHDGLVHISEMSDKFIKNPSEVVSVGDIIKVKVIKIDKDRQKVGLSMKGTFL